MRKFILTTLLTLASLLTFAVDPIIDPLIVNVLWELKIDSIHVVKNTDGTYDTIRFRDGSDGQVLSKSGSNWIPVSLSFIDTALISTNPLFTSASNDSISSQFAIKTFTLQSISDSISGTSSIDEIIYNPLDGYIRIYSNNVVIDSTSFKTLGSVDAINFSQNAPIVDSLFSISVDTANQTLKLIRGDLVTSNQLGEELNTPLVCNETGVQIDDITPVVINGTDGNGCATITAASNLTYDGSRLIGVLTQDVANGAKGRATIYGDVNADFSSSGLSTGIVYLGESGTITNTKPSGGKWVIIIGYLHDNSVSGKLFVNPMITERTAEQNKNNGFTFTERFATSISFNNSNRYFKIEPNSSEYYYYDDGDKYIKTEADSVQITDVSGLHVFYFDSEVLKTVENPNAGEVDQLIREEVLIAYVYWNSTDQAYYYIGDERHNLMDVLTHSNLHFTRGAQLSAEGIKDGDFLLTDITADGSGNVDSTAQFGVQSGTLIDEDLPSFVDAVLPATGLPIFYKTGANSEWKRVFQSGFSVYNTGSANGRLYYNEYTGGSWQLTQVSSNNDFVLCHVFATNDLDYGTLAIMGEEQYGTLGAAREGANVELSDLSIDGLPAEEIRPIATIIYQTSAAYANDVQARVRSTDLGDDYIDWRSTEAFGAGGSSGTVTSFDDLTDTDSPKVANALLRADGTGTTIGYSVPATTIINGSDSIPTSDAIYDYYRDSSLIAYLDTENVFEKKIVLEDSLMVNEYSLFKKTVRVDGDGSAAPLRLNRTDDFGSLELYHKDTLGGLIGTDDLGTINFYNHRATETASIDSLKLFTSFGAILATTNIGGSSYGLSTPISDTELGYVDGTTSNIQTQLDKKRIYPTEKKWCIFGDSFSDDIGASGDYPKNVIDKLGITGTVTNAVSGNGILDQISVMDGLLSGDPTYFDDFNTVSIHIGVNDFLIDTLPLGYRTDVSTEISYAGYLKRFIETIITATPEIELYIIATMETNHAVALYNSRNESGWTLNEMSVLISQICSDYAIQCIDLYSLSGFNLQTISTLTSDLLHPNTAGKAIIGDIVAESFMNRGNKGRMTNSDNNDIQNSIVGGYYYLTGFSSCIDISTIDETIISDDFTFSITLNKKDKGANNNDRIVDITIDANNSFQLVTDDASNKYGVRLRIGGVDVINQLSYGSYQTDEIVNITYTVSGGVGVFYRNGKQISSDGSLTIGIAGTGAFIGKRADGNGTTFFNGEIYDAKLYNRALTSSEVYNLSQGSPVHFADIGANQTSQTSGTLETGKRYRLTNWITNDDFTNIGAESNTDGVEFIATGTTPTTWTNSSEITQIGQTSYYDKSGMGHNTWMDKSGNDLFGTVTATYSNIPISDNEEVRQDVITTDTQILSSSNIIPDGYLLKYIIGTETAGNTGTIDAGTTAGASNIFSQVVFTASSTVLVETNFINFSGGNYAVYVNDDGAGTWNSSSINFVFVLQKIK